MFVFGYQQEVLRNRENDLSDRISLQHADEDLFSSCTIFIFLLPLSLHQYMFCLLQHTSCTSVCLQLLFLNGLYLLNVMVYNGVLSNDYEESSN